MGRCREAAHVAPDLGDDAGGGERADPGEGGQPPGGLLKRVEAVVERGEGAVDGGDLVEVDLQQVPLMFGEPATQGLDHLPSRRADAALDPIGQALRIGLAGRQRRQDGAPAGAEDGCR
jgi:hypothetical protein